MKHPLPTTLILVILFLAAQATGIALLFMGMSVETVDGAQVATHSEPVIGPRPQTSGGQSFLFLAAGVAIGTILLLALIRLRAFRLWKAWFLLAVWLSVSIALGMLMHPATAFTIAAVIALWKIYRPNPVVHNLSEIFMYAGIAILIVPLFDLLWAVILLAAISLYDIIAVWYSKHMVTMAKAQTENNLFAGLYIPKRTGKPGQKAKRIADAPPSPPRSGAAILGGGDIAFPLIFSGVVMTWLVETGTAPLAALYQTLIVTAGATLALFLLFWFAKKDRFYPAMPFLSGGCLLGLGIIALL